MKVLLKNDSLKESVMIDVPDKIFNVLKKGDFIVYNKKSYKIRAIQYNLETKGVIYETQLAE